jgi:hypothetical protein
MKFGLDNYTILLSFEPYPIDCRDEIEIDEYSILSIPGYDTGFTFNSFKRYKFETFTTGKKCISLKSTIQEERRTTLMVVVDAYNKFIKLYQDNELIDEVTFEGRLMAYHKKKFMYLGKALEESQNKRRPFKGIINQLAIWNHSLEPGQVKSVFDNLQLGVTEQFEGYTTPHCLELAYDMKASNYHTLYDLSGNGNNAKIHHCNRVATHHTEDFREIPIPWRRESTFKLLPHKDNGFYENKWTYTETRKNQLKFYNKVLKGKTNWRRDGMENLKYKVVSDNKLNYADDNNNPVEINFLSVTL